ncbi:MAG: hypothetical protein HY973_02125 [Candidatus Kerfeldbacteria bacterium]|nr:hypothetical protein [Candidatus Kerfeldbacteria bacterium]
MDTIRDSLIQLELTDKEIEIYLACLELGNATVQELANKSGLKRTNIYNYLEDLKQKGLMTEIQYKHKTLLLAENPQVLKQRAEEKIKEAESHLQEVNKIMPELLGIFNLPGEKPKVKFYQGVAGIKKIYDDTLTSSETIHAFTDYEKMFTVMTPEYMIKYAEARAAKGILFYTLAQPGPWAQKMINLNKKHKREIKLLKNVQLETEINIYGNKVALLSFRRPYTGIIIEDRAISHTLKTIWQVIWNSKNN